jgi:hypothetical protein
LNDLLKDSRFKFLSCDNHEKSNSKEILGLMKTMFQLFSITFFENDLFYKFDLLDLNNLIVA